jgi:protein-S-isoprenylcysteine O-methyltransferase Ste14
MRPLPFTWPYALLFWAVEIWAFYPEMRILRNAKKGETKDAKSLQVILFGLNVAYFIAFFIAWVPSLMIASNRVQVFFFGVALMIAGSILRRHCFRMLGTSFTGEVRARPDQVVVNRGAYSILRHPSYTAAILLNTGIGLALGSWASFLVLLVTSLVVYTYRMRVEERALVTEIGDPYREFMRTRKRIIPYIY